MKPAPWTLSPQLTEAPELWRGAELVLACWEGSNKPIDLIKGISSLGAWEGLEFAWVATPDCLAFRKRNGTDEYLLEYSPSAAGEYITGWNEITIAGVLTRIDNAEGAILASGNVSNGANSDDQELNLRYDSSGFSTGGSDLFKFSFGNSAVEFGDGKFVQNERIPFVVTAPGANNSTASLYLEGGYSETASFSPTLPVTVADAGIKVLSGVKGGLAADLEILFVSSFEWSEADARKFIQDPFSMLRPRGL